MKVLVLFIAVGLAWLSVFNEPYELNVPKGFPVPEIPADNAMSSERVELGRKLFFDPALSMDSSKSCGSCHLPELAFTDGLQVSEGIKGRKVQRNAPSLANMAYMTSFMRDGGIPTLEMQVESPIQEHNEMDLSLPFVAHRMKKNPSYVDMSLAAYNRVPDPFVVTRAIAAFERTLTSGDSPYDRYINGDESALNESEKKGLEVFKSKGCDNCHSGFLFTDQSLQNTGLYESYQDSGRMRITNKSVDRALFKVPSLRNVGLTAPYMHDGSMPDLNAVVQHYRSGGQNHENKSNLINPLDIDANQETQLIAFLNALTDNDLISKDYQNN